MGGTNSFNPLQNASFTRLAREDIWKFEIHEHFYRCARISISLVAYIVLPEQMMLLARISKCIFFTSHSSYNVQLYTSTKWYVLEVSPIEPTSHQTAGNEEVWQNQDPFLTSKRNIKAAPDNTIETMEHGSRGPEGVHLPLLDSFYIALVALKRKRHYWKSLKLKRIRKKNMWYSLSTITHPWTQATYTQFEVFHG